jgi:hypothetical protein
VAVLRTGEFTPQGARDTLGLLLRRESARPGTGAGRGADSGRAALLAAARLLDWERRDELSAAGRRFRIARVEEFVRLGPGVSDLVIWRSTGRALWRRLGKAPRASRSSAAAHHASALAVQVVRPRVAAGAPYGLGGHLDLSDAGPDGAVTVAESDRIRRSLRAGSAPNAAD